MKPTHTNVLERADAGEPAEAIAKATDLSLGYVYGILRKHRPDRERKARRRTSKLPAAVVGMHKRGIKPARIAVLKQVSRAYVYRILTEAGESVE